MLFLLSKQHPPLNPPSKPLADKKKRPDECPSKRIPCFVCRNANSFVGFLIPDEQLTAKPEAALPR
jgi:hypothetical protein